MAKSNRGTGGINSFGKNESPNEILVTNQDVIDSTMDTLDAESKEAGTTATFLFENPSRAVSMAGNISFEMLMHPKRVPVTVKLPPQIEKVMKEWLAQSDNCKGYVNIQDIDYALETKGLWKSGTGKSYKQDVLTILLHYRAKLLGKEAWNKTSKFDGTVQQLCTFK